MKQNLYQSQNGVKKVSWEPTPNGKLDGHPKSSSHAALDNSDMNRSSKQQHQKLSRSTNDKAIKDELSDLRSSKKIHHAPERSNSEPNVFSSSKQAHPKVSKQKPIHICILCAPEKKFFVKNLQIQLESAGYSCTLCSSADDYIPISEAETVICLLSLRYCQSSIAARAIYKAEKLQKPIVPLLLDNIEYPPKGPLESPMSKLVPVDCTEIRFNSKWQDEDQFGEILDRMESYISEVKPKRNKEKAGTQHPSNIPRAVQSIRREKTMPLERSLPMPMDPLAREASEIKIMIRPPTPVRKDVSNIPLPQRLQVPGQSNKHKDSTSEEDEEEDDEDPDTGDNEDEDEDESSVESEGYASTDSDVREARQMQKANKLPQLPDVKRRMNEVNQRQQQQKETDYQNGNALPKKVDASKNTRNNASYNSYDPGGPKLPSVYRQKNNNRSY